MCFMHNERMSCFMEMMQSIADMATNMSAAQTSMQIGTSVLKKAMDTEAQAATQLLESFAQAFPGDNGYLFDAMA